MKRFLSVVGAAAILLALIGWAAGPDRRREACIAAGLPVIDSRALPFEVVCDLAVRGPMVAVGEPASPPPWGAFSYAPLAAVADAYRAAGAEVWNLPATAPAAARE